MQHTLWNFDKPLSDEEILWVFQQGTPMTRKDVADKLRRAKSPTLITRLNKLAHEGFLHVEFFTLPNRVDMWVYTLTDKGCQWQYEVSGESPVFAPLEEGA